MGEASAVGGLVEDEDQRATTMDQDQKTADKIASEDQLQGESQPRSLAFALASPSTRWAPCASHGILGFFATLYSVDAVVFGQRGRSWPFEDLSAADGGAVLAALGALMLGNAVLLDSLMAGKVGDERAVPGWLRGVRFSLASIPLIGMYTVPAWLWLLENHRDRVLSLLPPPQLQPADSPWRRLLPQRYGVLFASRAQWLVQAPFFFLGLLAVNFLVLQGVVLWWIAFGSDPFGLPRGLVASTLLHGAIFVCALSNVVSLRHLLVLKPLRRLLVWALTLLWWLPAPYCILGGLVYPIFDSSERQLLLARAAFRGRQEWIRKGIDVYSYLRRTIRPWPEGSSPGQPLEAQQGMRRFYRVKLALLAGEAFALAAILMWTADKIPALQGLVGLGIHLGFLLSLAFAALFAALGVGVALVRRLVRRESERPPYFSYAVASQIALATGTFLGALLGGRNFAVFANSLYSVSLVGCLLVAIPAILLRRVFADRALLRWSGMFMAVALLAAWILEGGPPAVLAWVLLVLMMLALPLLVVGSGVVLGPWILRPLTLSAVHDARLGGWSRWCLGMLAFSWVVPFGGLLIPFWLLVRQRFLPGLEQHLGAVSWPVAAAVETVVEGRQDAAAGREPSPRAAAVARREPSRSQDFAFRQAIHHLASSGEVNRLWAALETKPFLADQARYFGGFRLCTDDLESAVLPLAIQHGDWDRFLHFALVALNVRALADRLTEEGLLDVLARRGRFDLALDAVNRLPDVPRRLLAATAIGVHLERTDRRFAELLDLLREDLEKLLLPVDEDTATRDRRILIEVAQAFGPELGSVLESQVGKWCATQWGEGLEDEVRVAAAWGCRQRSPGDLGEGCWEFLGKVCSPRVLEAHLPEILASLEECEDPDGLLERARTLPAVLGEELLWRCRVALLGVVAEREPESSRRLWRRWRAAAPISWSTDLVVDGARFFGHWPHGELEQLVAGIQPAEARVALWLVALFGRKERSAGEGVEKMAAAARAAIDELSATEQLSWLLPWIDAVHTFSVAGTALELGRLAAVLMQAVHGTPPEQMVRFFDLVAVLRPRDLRRWMANTVISSQQGPQLLLALAENSREELVLETLWEQAEHYMLGFSLSTDEVTELWDKVQMSVASRLCVLRQDLVYLEQVCRRVRDQDAVRITTAEALAAGGQVDLAANVCTTIQGHQRRLMAELRFLSGRRDATTEEPLAPDRLYDTLARVEEMEDEVQVLSALRASQRPMDALFRSHLAPLCNRDRQVPTLIRLLQRRLTLVPSGTRSERREQRVGWQVLEQAMASSPPDEALVALTPELPALSRPLGYGRVAEEIHESFRQLLMLEAVPWGERWRALESMVARIDRVYFETTVSRHRPARQHRRVAGLLRVLAAEIRAARGTEGEELLPLLVAVAERLPPQVARYLGHRQARCRWRRSWLPRPPMVELGSAMKPEEEILALCVADDEQRMLYARRQDLAACPRTVQTLVYLMARRQPEMVPLLVGTLPAGVGRDDLSLRLIRHRWVSVEVARQLLTLIADPRLYSEAALWRGFEVAEGNPEDAWCRDFAALTAQQDLDPDDLRYEPWLRAVREGDPRSSLLPLATAFLQTLGAGSLERAGRIMRLWLHAREGLGGHRRETMGRLRAILAKARRLSPELS